MGTVEAATAFLQALRIGFSTDELAMMSALDLFEYPSLAHRTEAEIYNLIHLGREAERRARLEAAGRAVC